MCTSALVTRACELKADAVIVDQSRNVRDPMEQPTYQAPRDPRRVQAGEAPLATPALGVPNICVADGRLIVWLDK